MKLLVALVLLSLFACISAANLKPLRCYITGSLDTSYKPLFETAYTCSQVLGTPQNATQCFKQTVSKTKDGRVKGVYYGCDYDGVCSGLTNGKCKSTDGVNTCCCADDLCNSAGMASFFTVATVMAAKMLF